MKEDEVMDNAKTVGLVVVGAAAGYAAIKKSPESARKFAGLAALLVGLGLQFVDSTEVNDLGLGIASVGGIDAIDNYVPEAIKTKNADLIPSLGAADDEIEDVTFSVEDNEEALLDKELISLEQGELQGVLPTDFELAGADEENALFTAENLDAI